MDKALRSVEDYIASLSQERREVIERLRQVIKAHLPDGFEECLSYGMIGYVVPHALYPPGYHVHPEEPLPFINLASQKNHIAIYHMGIYSDEALLKWFREAYKASMTTKLDMGKSCIRFKNMKTIPYDLIGELCEKMSTESYIDLYEKSIQKK